MANDPDTRHRRNARVTPGDITQRLRDAYIPDFYRDLTVGGQTMVGGALSTNTGALIAFLEKCGPSLDYFLEYAKRLPQLLQIDHAPWQLLPYFGSMIGYHWDPSKDAEVQRRDIEFFFQQCKIKGTRRGIERAVLKSGATRAVVTNLSDRLFLIAGAPQRARFVNLGPEQPPGLLGSQISGADRLPDPTVFRYGVYEISTDLALPRFINALMCYAHPAGTSFVANVDGQRVRAIGSPGDEAFHASFETAFEDDVLLEVSERAAADDTADPAVSAILSVSYQAFGTAVSGTADTDPTSPSILFEITQV